MADLAKQFQTELLDKCAIAERELGYHSTRLMMMIEKHEAVPTVTQIIRKKGISDSFVDLQQHGRMDLTVEALVVDSRYAPLFSDEEVNTCFDTLCECGYFNK